MGSGTRELGVETCVWAMRSLSGLEVAESIEKQA